MTGQEIINMIKEMNLENEVVYLEHGSVISGEINFTKIKGIEKENEWYHCAWFTAE